jgi:hypothetical protein
VVVATDATVPHYRDIAPSGRWRRALELLAAAVCLCLTLWSLLVLGYVSFVGSVYGTWLEPAKIRNNSLLFAFSVFTFYLALSFAEGRKYSALYLRRFRSEVNSFVAAAIDRGVGRRFRVVTLDDERFVPIEVPRLEKWSSRLIPVLILCGAGALAIWTIRMSINSEDLAVENYTQLYAVQYVRMLGFWTWHVWCLLFILLAHRFWIRRHAHVRVSTVPDLVTAEFFAWKLRAWRNRSGLMAPQATIVTVTDALWRAAVIRLLRFVDVVLIDVSDPSDALAWEVTHLEQPSSPPCVFVAEATRFQAWTEAAAQTAAEETSNAIILRALASKTVLLYTYGPGDRLNVVPFKRNVTNTLRAAMAGRTRVVSTPSDVEAQRFPRLLRSLFYYGSVSVIAALTGYFIAEQMVLWVWRLYFGHLDSI